MLTALLLERGISLEVLGAIATAYNFNPLLFQNINNAIQPIPMRLVQILSSVTGISANDIIDAVKTTTLDPSFGLRIPNEFQSGSRARAIRLAPTAQPSIAYIPPRAPGVGGGGGGPRLCR